MSSPTTQRRRTQPEPAPDDPRTAAARAAEGRAARAAAPRSGHAELPTLPADRDPLAILAAQDAARVPELLPIRYGRMAVTPFTFYRGAAAVMAADLAATPTSGITVQLCGDAHLSNFGLFASPERRLVFDINDFDETLPGPWEWDIKRLVASVEVAARDRGFAPPERQAAVESTARTYRETMRSFAEMPTLHVWYAHADAEQIKDVVTPQLKTRGRKRLGRGFAKARTRDHLGSLNRFATVADDGLQLKAAPPIIVPMRDLLPDPAVRTAFEGRLRNLLNDYHDSLPADRRVLLDQYRIVDIARKVVGVGSVGTRSFMVLLLGRDDRDPLFLQAKEAGPSVLEAYLGPGEHDNHGERVVMGQRLMQTVGDIFLGWQRTAGIDGQERDFYIRQLRDWKGSVEVEEMQPQGLRLYARLCGWTLARAHARTGDRIAIASYLGASTAFDRAMARFADTYADLNESDHSSLCNAVATGRVRATEI
jgi:uncharacterized protein (DUF2252 family)